MTQKNKKVHVTYELQTQFCTNQPLEEFGIFLAEFKDARGNLVYVHFDQEGKMIIYANGSPQEQKSSIEVSEDVCKVFRGVPGNDCLFYFSSVPKILSNQFILVKSYRNTMSYIVDIVNQKVVFLPTPTGEEKANVIDVEVLSDRYNVFANSTYRSYDKDWNLILYTTKSGEKIAEFGSCMIRSDEELRLVPLASSSSIIIDRQTNTEM